MLAEYGLLDLMGSRLPNLDILGATLDLFRGHPVPALLGARGWHPAPQTSRRTAFAAHLLGDAVVGSYPFRGVPLSSCACPDRAHICAGLGCDYLCVDLDDHHEQGGMHGMIVRTRCAAYDLGLRTLTFTSRGGNGAHLYVFFDEAVGTAQAHDLGVQIARTAGVGGRADVLPSAGHPTGFGTMHALPLSPNTHDSGGGLLLDDQLRPITQGGRVVQVLRDAHLNRNRVRDLMSADDFLPCAPASSAGSAEPPRRAALRPQTRLVRVSDGALVASMRKHHPQFRRALAAASSGAWQGGKSARDAHLAAQMLRQGVSPLGVADALVRLPGTKSAERGIVYARALVTAAVRVQRESNPAQTGKPPERFAGCPRKATRRATPWADREPPPLDYEGERNPWWEPHVQSRLAALRTKKRDSAVLAYVVDRWYRGDLRRRTYYAGVRAIGRDLGMSASSVGASVRRLAKVFPDVIRVTPGVPHPRLRLATAFGVVGSRTSDSFDWHDAPGQSVSQRLSCLQVKHAEAVDEDNRSAPGTGMAFGHAGNRTDIVAGGSKEAPAPGAHPLSEGLQRRPDHGRLLARARGVVPHPSRLRSDSGRCVAP